MTEIVHDEEHSDGAPTIGDIGIRVVNVADAYEYSGYSPDEIADFYPTLTLEDIHTALAYFYGHMQEDDHLASRAAQEAASSVSTVDDYYDEE